MDVKPLARLAPALLACLVLLISAGPSSAAIFGPPKGKVLTGVSDDGSLESFQNWTETVGKHPAVLQTFHPWGNGLDLAYERWENARVTPMLHISTADDETLEELITPQEIATGAGDPYLWKMNRFFAENGLRAYIRPLGEPNRCRNAWSAVNCDGSRRGGDHTTYWYRKAFQRIAVIVRGGRKTENINRLLRKLRMRHVQWGSTKRPETMPAAAVSMVWSPLPAGSPKVRGNWPGNYWPGSYFVDWAGTDFYSNHPYWRDLNRFMRGRPWRDKPVAITEWGVTGSDDVRFVRQKFHWVNRRHRVRMFLYYRGFGDYDPYNPYYYPEAVRVMRNKLKDDRFLPFSFGHARR